MLIAISSTLIPSSPIILFYKEFVPLAYSTHSLYLVAAVSSSYVNFNPGSKGAKQRMGNSLDQHIYVPGCYMVSMISFLAIGCNFLVMYLPSFLDFSTSFIFNIKYYGHITLACFLIVYVSSF
jgi:hypothetical protein